jgi:hypothetical protein
VPQSYAWGVEAQVDWYEAYADLAGERTKPAGLFDAEHGQRRSLSLRIPARHPTGFSQSARTRFRLLFRCFPQASLRYLTSAVRKILRGHQREETSRFIAFRPHWRFESEFS